ncbi:PTS sugar transporter subunit IIA, partial [Klebsiella pneumoniae]|uniref:PTS sugar transporter subunit IIA n=1 Tax=Klebsiella pneumoniae TaxID=573 RepID=UPI003CCB1182
DLTQQLEALVARFPAQDELTVITDIFAGSVNNEFVRFLSRPPFPFLSRFHLPLLFYFPFFASREATPKYNNTDFTNAHKSD